MAPSCDRAPCSSSRWDQWGLFGSALSFALALQMGRVVVPLLALEVGLGATGVGLLTAASAVSQIGARGALPALMRRVSERRLIQTAAVLLSASYAMLVASQSVQAFLVAEAAQGCARAFFWTGSQTHLVRGEGRATGRLAKLSILGGLGGTLGPFIAGIVSDRSLLVAAGLAGFIAFATLAPSAAVKPLPNPHVVLDGDRDIRSPRQPLRAIPGVRRGSWASFAVGGWRALMNSYIPVVLELAEHSASTIGGILAIADGALMLISMVLARQDPELSSRLVTIAGVALALGLVLSTVLASNPTMAGLWLAVSGAASGALQVAGPSVASAAVPEERRGDAIVTTGLFRSVAHLASPFAVVVLIPTAGVLMAVVSVEVALAVPLWISGRRDRSQRLDG